MDAERDSTQRVDEVVRSPGEALDPGARAALQSSLGKDFGKVRIHTDSSAAASAEALGAVAYTVGAHIAFARERYAPRTTPGERLLAHELMHTIQQGQADVMHLNDLRTLPVDGPQEEEARRAGAGDFPAAATTSPVAIARALPGGPEETGVAAPLGRGGAATALDIEFHAFIPGALGRPFASFPHARDVKNQAAFDAAVAAVTSPSSWKPQPRKTESDVTEPGAARNVWFYSTDERGFGGGGHRVGFKGGVSVADVGNLRTRGTIFSHSCDPSHRVRSTDTGMFTSSNETGTVEGPFAKIAPVKSVSEKVSDSGTSSTVQTGGQAAYAFMPTLSPDIDYGVTFGFSRKTGGIEVSSMVDHNLFPFYEILINGVRHWAFSSADTGPIDQSQLEHDGLREAPDVLIRTALDLTRHRGSRSPLLWDGSEQLPSRGYIPRPWAYT